jgi:hypothetical protein
VIIPLTCSRQKQKRFLTNSSLFCPACREQGYGRGNGVGRGLGGGLGLGDGVGLGVAVGVGVGVPPVGAWIATIMGEPVLKNPTVAFVLTGG